MWVDRPLLCHVHPPPRSYMLVRLTSVLRPAGRPPESWLTSKLLHSTDEQGGIFSLVEHLHGFQAGEFFNGGGHRSRDVVVTQITIKNRPHFFRLWFYGFHFEYYMFWRSGNWSKLFGSCPTRLLYARSLCRKEKREREGLLLLVIMQGGPSSWDKETYSFKTCPMLLQWTLYQLQQVDMSAESHPVRTIHVLPFSDLYSCCRFWHTVGFTVLFTAVGRSLSMDVGCAVASEDVAVGTADDSLSLAVGVAVISLSMAEEVSDAMAEDVSGDADVSSPASSCWQMANATRNSRRSRMLLFIVRNKREEKSEKERSASGYTQLIGGQQSRNWKTSK